MNHRIAVLYPRAEIVTTIKKLAGELNKEYAGKNPVVIGVLKGAFVFMADLVRELSFPLEIDFVRLASYGEEQVSSGEVEILADIRLAVKGRHVLIVEDIIDTGKTIAFYKKYLKDKKPASIKICALLDKPSHREVKVEVDYIGMTVPDKFLVGYGLDWAEKYRNLPDICYVEENTD
ncbi:MAG: hypoxanthine phosphoribosyltransferase [Dehalococcoidales bacterium]|nr:hypoxanthine phosphoribosyltransferase [Dehalococcoidales bacterium]